MGRLPNEIKLSDHAKRRLEERREKGTIYNVRNIMRSPVKWYSKEDLIYDCPLYRHSCYTTRQSKDLMYITDGSIEVIYDKNTKVGVTVLPVKDTFKPITQYIKPELLNKIQEKKENKKRMKKLGNCPDCGREEVELTSRGVCVVCRRRQDNMKARGKEYIPYINLSDKERERIDNAQNAQRKLREEKDTIEIPELPKTRQVIENYYQVKAENNPAIARVTEQSVATTQSFEKLSNQINFIQILKEYGCDIPKENLENVLNILMTTDKLKDIFMDITKNENQQTILNLEQELNLVEKKLQHDWEYNGFQSADDIKFKGFLTWRRVLKGAITFWKKLYQTNAIIEMQKSWNAYMQNPEEDNVTHDESNSDNVMKRYQITTDSISTIFNTRRPFTRVFYATDEKSAYETFKQWMADRNLHEDPKKTTIVELKNEGEIPQRKDKR